VCDIVTRSGKLMLLDVAELNPTSTTGPARAAARLIHRVVTGRLH
jgi:formiminoglutamase